MRITEKNCIIFLCIIFLFFSILIAVIPYDPEIDLADATTNDIWIDNYEKGIYHIPYDEWDHDPTQSVVIEYKDDYVVVNEKGPGHVMMLLPFHVLGIEFLFGPLMVAIAAVSTYLLGKRLCNWQVGFFASLMVLTSSLVLVMWNQYYWTDASTMHMLIFSIWLLVEGIYWFNGHSLNPKSENDSDLKQKTIGTTLCFFSGLTFGMSVSTRYPTGLMIIAIISFVLAFYFVKVLPDLKQKKIIKALKKSAGMWIIFGILLIGLLVVMIPLMNYNSEYFGNPLGSGYDGTLLLDADAEGNDPYAGTAGPSEVGLISRNISSTWTGNILSFEKISKIVSNFFTLLPVFLMRMPYIIFVPFGIYFFRKKPAMILLFLLIFINFFTYLSLSIVELYAAHPEAVFEPRYFMPALPAAALLGGIGIYALAKWMINKKGKPAAKKFVIIVVCIMLVISIISAAIYFVLFRGAIPDPRHMPPDGKMPFGPPRPPKPSGHQHGSLSNIVKENICCKTNFDGVIPVS